MRHRARSSTAAAAVAAAAAADAQHALDKRSCNSDGAQQQQQQQQHKQQQHKQQQQQHAQTPAPALDLSQPLVAAVGTLGPAYWRWVHAPVPGVPRFFASDALENLTRCPWWVVPLVWLPAVAALAAAALWRHGLAAPGLLALQLQGAVLWQGLEYAIHRWAFHAHVSSYWGITLHFLFHGNHHKFPKDGMRLVFPPVPAAAIAAGIFASLRAVLPPGPAAGLMSGVLLGYVAYDCLHYGMHHAAHLPGGLLQELRARHAHHHYQQADTGYGISSVLFDALLGTRAAGVRLFH